MQAKEQYPKLSLKSLDTVFRFRQQPVSREKENRTEENTTLNQKMIVLRLIDYNGFIEYAQYVDHYYGTPRKFVEDELEAGHVVILEIEVQGAMKLKEQYPDAILLFITAPSIEVLKNRLIGRGTETAEVVEKRMRRAAEEAESIEQYEFIVSNEEGKLEDCMNTIHSIH